MGKIGLPRPPEDCYAGLERVVTALTVQTREFPFGRALLLNTLYDAADEIGAKLIGGDSTQGLLCLRLPDGYGELTVQVQGEQPCRVTVSAGSEKAPKFGYEQEHWTIQYLFSKLELLLAGLK